MSDLAQQVAADIERALGPRFLCPICNQLVYEEHNTNPDDPCTPHASVQWIGAQAWRYLMVGKGPKAKARGYAVR